MENDSGLRQPRQRTTGRPAARGRSRRPASTQRHPGLRADHEARLAEAERALAEAFDRLIMAGVAAQAVEPAFLSITTSIAAAQARRQHAAEQYAARHARAELSQDPQARLVIPDVPGTDWRPDLESVRTAAAYLDALRQYRLWAGNPSLRTIARQCGHRFAASTICGVLKGSDLPSQDMADAIIVGCGGREEHRQAFASAWRSLVLPRAGGQ